MAVYFPLYFDGTQLRQTSATRPIAPSALTGVLLSDGSVAASGALTGVDGTLPTNLTTQAWVSAAVTGSSWGPPVVATTSTPPGSPSAGARWIVGGTPTGAWTGHATAIATWSGSAWVYLSAVAGAVVFDSGAGVYRAFNGTSWVNLNTYWLHNLLSDLQGGTTAQFYHLTAAEYTAAFSTATAAGSFFAAPTSTTGPGGFRALIPADISGSTVDATVVVRRSGVPVWGTLSAVDVGAVGASTANTFTALQTFTNGIAVTGGTLALPAASVTSTMINSIGPNQITGASALGISVLTSANTAALYTILGVGAANGICPLDGTSKVPLANLPASASGNTVAINGSDPSPGYLAAKVDGATIVADTSAWVIKVGTIVNANVANGAAIAFNKLSGVQASSAELTALAAMSSVGIVARTGSATYSDLAYTAPGALGLQGLGAVAVATTTQSPAVTGSTTTYQNTGAISLVSVVLPTTPTVGTTFRIVVLNVNGIKFQAPTGATIWVGSTQSSSGGYASSTTVGSTLTLEAIDTATWVAVAQTGTWTTA